MDSFVETILFKITRPGCDLSIVQNTDGFLSRVDTQDAFIQEAGITLLPVTPLALRIHYERWFKDSGERYCYIVNDLDSVAPDIKANAHCCIFNVCDILWGYDKMEILKWNAPYAILNHLFEKKQSCFLTAEQTREEMGYVADEYEVRDLDKISQNFRNIEIDWLSAESMEQLCRYILSAINNRFYNQIEFLIDEANQNFQSFVDSSYRGLLSKIHVKRPYSVNNVLKHINYVNANTTDRIALFVIDGMAYWQYLMLKDALTERSIDVEDNICYAWMPSITKLSRQALFRGDMPKDSYVQNPQNESKLWFDYWEKKGVSDYAIWYEHNGIINHPEQYTKYGYVTTSLDHHMHGCRDLKDLYDLTANRILEIVENIERLYSAGFTVYITADHGNVYSHAWRALNSQEKAMLYTNESRGGRHLIFTKDEYQNYFFQHNQDIVQDMLISGHFAVWRNKYCFKGTDEVTHGGCHFLEMIVPFAKIKKE